MPKPTKRDQLLQVRKDLAEALFHLAGDDNNWEQGFIAVLRARATICEITGDIDGSREANRTLNTIKEFQKDTGLSLYNIVRLNHAHSNQG